MYLKANIYFMECLSEPEAHRIKRKLLPTDQPCIAMAFLSMTESCLQSTKDLYFFKPRLQVTGIKKKNRAQQRKTYFLL